MRSFLLSERSSAGCAGVIFGAASAGRASKQEPSWKFGFQMNERYLEWGESGQGRFLKLHCGEKLGWTPEQVWHQPHVFSCPFLASSDLFSIVRSSLAQESDTRVPSDLVSRISVD